MKNKTQLIILSVIIGLVNLPLLFGTINTSMVFTPTTFLNGNWWQLFTHPFVHVSPYHLLLDAGAFLYLYHTLQHHKYRFAYVVSAATGSLLLCLCLSSMNNGLCGLSGIAHGLLAISAIDYLKDTDPLLRKTGLITLIAVTGKSILELLIGGPLFGLLHVGNVGAPVAACHAGGILGAIAPQTILNHLLKKKKK